MDKEARGDLHGEVPLSPLDFKSEKSKEAVWNLATLPQGDEQEDEVPTNKFLSKRAEAIMMTAICAALFGEWTSDSVIPTELMRLFLKVAGWNDASVGPLIPSLQEHYHVSPTSPSTQPN